MIDILCIPKRRSIQGQQYTVSHISRNNSSNIYLNYNNNLGFIRNNQKSNTHTHTLINEKRDLINLKSNNGA